MGNCSVDSVGWDDSSEDSKIDTEQKPFTFNTDDLNDSGDSMEGWLEKKSKHLGKWRKRYTILSKQTDGESQFILQTFKEKESRKNATETILINDEIEIDTNTSNSNEFSIYHKATKSIFTFKASSNKQRTAWLNMLQFHYNNINEYENNEKYIININETNTTIEIKNIDSNQIYSANISNEIMQQKQCNKLRLKLDETKRIMTVIYFENDKTNSIILKENISRENNNNDDEKNEEKQRDEIELENNKKSYNKYDMKLECDSKTNDLNIEMKHLKSNEIYCTNIENNKIKMIANVLQWIEKSKQDCTLKIVLKECNKLKQILNLSENYIELILQLNKNESHIIELKKLKKESKTECKNENNKEEIEYKSAIINLSKNGNGAYGSMEGLVNRSVFKQHKNEKDPISQNTKKIMREIRKDLPENIYLSYENGSMFVRFDESNPRYIQALLIGLSDTPYYNGCFLFDIYLCKDYPNIAPKIRHISNGACLPTANNGPGGFSPNLHKSTGKVCLSLLGTWSGPSWQANKSNVYQILSTLLFMVFGAKHPYYMEPNYGGWEGTVNDPKKKHDIKVFQYDEELLYHTAKSTILEMLKKPYVGFETVIKTHFKFKKKQIIQHMHQIINCKDYSKAFKNKIKPIHEEIKTELNKF